MVLDNVTLFIYETRSLELALFSIKKSTNYVRFHKIIFATTNAIISTAKNSQLDGIELTPVDQSISYSEYVIRRLPWLIETDFVLITQWDSWVINPSGWEDEFMRYDYIGSPWPNKNKNVVGNGGFSLRSKKLLAATGMLRSTDFHPEDLYICERNRDELEEKYKIAFAPFEVASKFAFERIPSKILTFGFHGLFNFYDVLEKDKLILYLDKSHDLLGGIDGYDLIKRVYALKDYDTAQKLLEMSTPKIHYKHKLKKIHYILKIKIIFMNYLDTYKKEPKEDKI